MKRALATLLLVLTPAFGCKSPPADDDCKVRNADGSVEFDCQTTPDDEWEERARKEAVEGMDERGPGSRP